jgi:hypothetical protein
MNGCMANYSALGAALTLVGAGFAAPTAAQPTLNAPPMHPNPLTQQAIIEASRNAPFPTFAQVPPLPTDVRSIAAWKESVTSLKAKGAQLTERVASEPWTLSGDTEAWAAGKRAAAEPPSPVTTPSSQADTEAFAAAMRARAMPPPRKR